LGAASGSRTCGEWDHIEAFIGKVKYLNKRLIRYANSVFKGGAEGLSSRLFAETLLVKRLAFAHEREVRLLFFRRDKASASDDLYPYSVDPHALIDQIMIASCAIGWMRSVTEPHCRTSLRLPRTFSGSFCDFAKSNLCSVRTEH
jgi:hypothetical protein